MSLWATLEDPELALDEELHRRRCGRCRQFGHIRTHCPHSDLEADRLTAEHNMRQRHYRTLDRLASRGDTAGVASALHAHETWMEERREAREREVRETRLEERIVELQSVVESLAERPDRPRGPSQLAVTMQEIIFENADKIPDGIYKQLMDTLMVSE